MQANRREAPKLRKTPSYYFTWRTHAITREDGTVTEVSYGLTRKGKASEGMNEFLAKVSRCARELDPLDKVPWDDTRQGLRCKRELQRAGCLTPSDSGKSKARWGQRAFADHTVAIRVAPGKVLQCLNFNSAPIGY